MFWLDGTIQGLSQSIPQHRSILIHLVNGTIASSYFNNRQQMSSRFVKVLIEPRITYFGLGQGATRTSSFRHLSIPKFYVSHIKSKDDIKMRFEIILNWIGQQPNLFEDIRSAMERG